MSVPSSVLAILERQNVRFNVAELDSDAPRLSLVSDQSAPCLVTAMLAHDGKKQVQILLPADRMIDLDAMFRQFGRHFEALRHTDVAPLFNQHQLTNIPAIPHWQGLATLVDSQLLKADKLYLESGIYGQVLELNRADFEQMIVGAEVGRFSIELPQPSVDPSLDETQILNSVDKFTERRIRQRLEETLEIPPLPDTAKRIIQLRSDPDADISDLAAIVELDPSLAAQVVSWAASPYYSAPGKIKSVHDAIVRILGFDMVLNLALGLSLGRTLLPHVLDKNNIHDYWRDAVFTAAAVEGLVTSIERKHRPGFGMAYLSGLLHNFGYIVLAEVFPPYFSNISRMRQANPHISSAMVEQHIIGISGNQIAAWLLDSWNMTPEVVTALRQKYNGDYRGDYHEYAKLVYIAEKLLANAGFNSALSCDIPAELFTDLHLDPDTARVTVQNILESSDDLNSIAVQMQN